MVRSFYQRLQKSLNQAPLTESTIQVNKKAAKYILGVMELATNWTQYKMKHNQLMRKLAIKPEMVESVISSLKNIAKMDDGEEEGTDE